MNDFEFSRRSVPVPPGLIPYGQFSYTDDRACVYSLDKFRPRFPLNWRNLVVFENGVAVPPDDKKVLEATRSFLRKIWSGFEACGAYHGVGRGGNLYWWKLESGIVTLHKFKPFGYDQNFYSLLFEFNPNKADLDFWRDMITSFRVGAGDWFRWSNTRLDYTLDIPYPISDVRLLTRKVASCYQGTYYFGSRGVSGYTRVYDKRKEILDKQRKDIGRDVTRIEWECRSGKPLHMDFPFIIQNLGRYEVLRFVPMNDWPAALRTFDQRTAAKIKRDCLRCIDVVPEYFENLSAGLFDYLGLTAADNIDSVSSFQIDDSSMESLESIQSQLRKWAGVEH